MPDVRYRQSERIDASTVDDRAVLYNLDSGTVLVLNPTGTWLWNEIALPTTAGALAEALVARASPAVPPDPLGDIATFLQQLVEHGAVSVESVGG